MASELLRKLFDVNAPIYDRVDALGSLGRGLIYRQEALERAGLGPGAKVLDVACGTGLMSLAATRLTQGRIVLTGVDPSPGMAARARMKVPLEYFEGRAESLPVSDGVFDFVMMGYALRHMTDLSRALREFGRVLRPGGRVLLLEVTRPATHLGRILFDLYFGGVLPVLGCLVTGRKGAWQLYRYYWRTMVSARPPTEVLAALASSGFIDAMHRPIHGCLSEYTARKS
jgi:demethylmenaquinone methyltransferase/2-methoxy-6-polyprenyl-1,4-benzoquinol methylase